MVVVHVQPGPGKIKQPHDSADDSDDEDGEDDEEEEEEGDGDNYDHHGQTTPRSGQRLPLGSKIVPTMMALMASQTLAYDAVDPQF